MTEWDQFYALADLLVHVIAPRILRAQGRSHSADWLETQAHITTSSTLAAVRHRVSDLVRAEWDSAVLRDVEEALYSEYGGNTSRPDTFAVATINYMLGKLVGRALVRDVVGVDGIAEISKLIHERNLDFKVARVLLEPE